MDSRKNPILKLLLILFCSLVLVILACIPEKELHAQSPKATPGLSNEWYNDHYRGWYWFEDPPVEEKKKEKEDSDKEETADVSLDNYTYDDLWNMDADSFHKLSDDIRKKAVSKPTEKNVYEYALLQDIARRKAAAFAGTYMLVSQKYPYLGNRDVSPITVPGLRAREALQKNNIEQTLLLNKDKFGLFVFTSSGCPFCDTQISILDHFTRTYGWEILYSDISNTKSANLAARYGITQTPSMLLVHRESGDAMPLAQGVVSVDELSRRLYRTIQYMKGERTPEQYYLYDYEKGSGADPLSLENIDIMLNQKEGRN